MARRVIQAKVNGTHAWYRFLETPPEQQAARDLGLCIVDGYPDEEAGLPDHNYLSNLWAGPYLARSLAHNVDNVVNRRANQILAFQHRPADLPPLPQEWRDAIPVPCSLCTQRVTSCSDYRATIKVARRRHEMPLAVQQVELVVCTSCATLPRLNLVNLLTALSRTIKTEATA